LLLLAATVGTGFYMSRLIFLTFFGRIRVEPHQHPHESPPVMGFPLGILAALALVGGLLGLGSESGRIQRWLAPHPASSVVPAGAEIGPLSATPVKFETGGLGDLSNVALSSIATAAGLAGAVAAGFMYLGGFDWQGRRERAGFLWRAARNRLYIDSFYEFLFTGFGKLVATALAFVVDTLWIDGVVNNVGRGMALLSAGVRRIQTGYVRSYAMGVLAGGVVLLGLLVGRTH
jgi:NADH-quinone oxidoreductase subunit L